MLYAFKGAPDGELPSAALIFDGHGALYGTTAEGGILSLSDAFGKGTVFKLTPPIPPATHWTETVLYRFKGLPDGAYPSASLIFDSHGALYGTTVQGGIPGLFGELGLGTVFKLTPPAPGHTQWTETVLHRFGVGSDGYGPVAGLIFDSHGALYGTTQRGGPSGLGTVFRMTPPAPGRAQWTETMLYNFKGTTPFPSKPQDGANPTAGLIFDRSGALYGTTAGGGTDFPKGGTVFKLTGF